MKTKTVLLSLLFISTAAFAQRSGERTGPAHASNYNTWSVGGHLGFTYTLADLYGFESDKAYVGYGLGLSLGKQVNYTFGFRMDATIGTLTGSHSSFTAFGSKPGIYFEGNFNELNGVATLNLSNLFLNGRKMDRKVIFVAGIGAGMTAFNSSVYQMDNDAYLGQVKAGPEWELQMTIPAELGLRYRLTDKLDLGLRGSWRWIWSDDIDGVRGVNPANLESFLYTNASITYSFGKKAEAAEWTNPLDDMYFEVQDMAATIDGMSNDADGDGVADLLDQDDYTPEGVAVDGSGKALDVDMDGIPDHLDADPFTPRGATVDDSGKEIDTDGDGVPDSRDMEANTPNGALVNFQGKEITATGDVGVSLPSVYFSFNSTSVNYANYERLATLARALKKNPSLKLNVVGNTDERGGEDANMKIGEKRAQAVVDHLVKIYGIDAARLSVSSKGESDLLANGVHRINRRVDFEVAK